MIKKTHPFLFSNFTMPTAILHLLKNYDVKQHQISQTGWQACTADTCFRTGTWMARQAVFNWHLLLFQHMNYPLGLSHLQLLQSRCQLTMYLCYHALHLLNWKKWTALLVSQTFAVCSSQISWCHPLAFGLSPSATVVVSTHHNWWLCQNSLHT